MLRLGTILHLLKLEGLLPLMNIFAKAFHKGCARRACTVSRAAEHRIRYVILRRLLASLAVVFYGLDLLFIFWIFWIFWVQGIFPKSSRASLL